MTLRHSASSVGTPRSLLQNIISFIGLFCKRDYNFKEPTNRSHPISTVGTNCRARLHGYGVAMISRLRKRPIILRSLLLEATPYIAMVWGGYD